MASENSQRNIAKKSFKNMRLAIIFGGFRGLNNQSHQIYGATFYSKFFITIIFYFLSQDTRWPRNMNKLNLNILDAFFLYRKQLLELHENS